MWIPISKAVLEHILRSDYSLKDFANVWLEWATILDPFWVRQEATYSTVEAPGKLHLPPSCLWALHRVICFFKPSAQIFAAFLHTKVAFLSLVQSIVDNNNCSNRVQSVWIFLFSSRLPTMQWLYVFFFFWESRLGRGHTEIRWVFQSFRLKDNSCRNS